MTTALVIGGGPAGLMAADAMASAGLSVTVADAKPTLARKFLMAGKSGLNLTKDEPFDDFLAAYGDSAGRLTPMLAQFGPDAVQDWARGLGQPVFTGSSGRVFPEVMKGSPLLRAWIARLDELAVGMRTRWRWTGWDGDDTVFDTPEGRVAMQPEVTVLAMGGASWSRLGSDGAWAGILTDAGVPLSPFKPANMGFVVDWTPHMARHFGAPVKGTTLRVAGREVRAEYVISGRGLEGGGIYAVSAAVRDGAALFIDLMPDWDADRIVAQLKKPRGKNSFSNHLRKSLRLDPVRQALLMEFGAPLPDGAELAALIKALPVRHQGPRPMDEAISTAGGVAWDGVDDDLMLAARKGVFCAGEMLDWEAPTGGYLLTGCFATGLWAGQAAARYAGASPKARR